MYCLHRIRWVIGLSYLITMAFLMHFAQAIAPRNHQEREIFIRETFEKKNWEKQATQLSEELIRELQSTSLPSSEWSRNYSLAILFKHFQQIHQQNPQWLKSHSKELIDLLLFDQLPEQLATAIQPEDHIFQAWKILIELYQKNFADLAQYPSLGVALALIYDSPLPPDWPHSQVSPLQIPLLSNPSSPLLSYFSQQYRKGVLTPQPSKLTHQELKFLLDAPLILSEYEWIHRQVKTPRSQFQAVFSLVRYDQSRIARFQYRWNPQTPYLLENIFKNGGICVDQAYFAWIAGKARGIPTLYFSGQGKEGGHAWFGFLKTDQQWEMNAGRYQNQNYVTGTAQDPQTGKEITDHELLLLTQRTSSEISYQKSLQILQLIQASSEIIKLEQRQKIWAQTIRFAPTHRELWIQLYQSKPLLLSNDDQKALLDIARQLYPTDSELRSLLGKTPSPLLLSQENSLQTLLREERFAKRPDLALKEAESYLGRVIDQKQYERAQKEFAMVVRQYQSEGGNTFHLLVRPYLLRLHKEQREKELREAYRLSQELLQLSSGSLTYLEFLALGKQLKIK